MWEKQIKCLIFSSRNISFVFVVDMMDLLISSQGDYMSCEHMNEDASTDHN